MKTKQQRSVALCVQQKWKQAYRHGQVAEIKEATGLSHTTIGMAINHRIASEATEEKITNFYKSLK